MGAKIQHLVFIEFTKTFIKPLLGVRLTDEARKGP